MATLVGNQIKLNNGQTITPNDGGWYDGQRYLGGKLLAPNEYEPGKQVSQEVRSQSATAQGVSLQQFDSFLASNMQSPVSLPYTSNTQSSSMAGLNSEVEKARKTLEDNLARQKAENDAKLADLRAKEQATLGQINTLTTPFRADLENTERERLYINKNFEDNQKLVDELDQLLTEGNNLISQQKSVTGLASVRNPRVQKTMDDVQARVGVIQAVMSARNGQIAQAENLIDRSISAITADRQDRISYYDTILNLNRQDIISLDTDNKKLAEEQVGLLKNDLAQAQETSNYVKQLMLNPTTSQLMGQAGVSLNDSIDVINQKLTKAQYANEVVEMNNKMALSGYTAVYDPKSVSSSQLITVTDSRGQKYYYKKSASASDTGGGLAWLNNNGMKVAQPTAKTDTKTNTPIVTPQQISSIQSIMNQVVAPDFAPSAGIGSRTVDSLGRVWIYERTGWRLAN